MARTRLGISACLLGYKVRYNGGDKRDDFITGALCRHFDLVPVCPEVEYGLPIPREPMRLTGDLASPRLVTIQTGVDHRSGMLEWAVTRLAALEKEGICGFVFKSRSPSCGRQGVSVYEEGKVVSYCGVGIFAAAFMKRFPLIPTEDERGLHDQKLREHFMERVLAPTKP